MMLIKAFLLFSLGKSLFSIYESNKTEISEALWKYKDQLRMGTRSTNGVATTTYTVHIVEASPYANVASLRAIAPSLHNNVASPQTTIASLYATNHYSQSVRHKPL